jgi:rubrerythrin
VKRQAVLEKGIVQRIMKALKNKRQVVVRKRHGTSMGVAGDPDLYGTINGRHFEIEVKRPGDSSAQLTELQTRRLMEWKLAGAITGVARSVEDVLIILGLARPVVALWACESCGSTWKGPAAPDSCPSCGHKRFAKELLSEDA